MNDVRVFDAATQRLIGRTWRKDELRMFTYFSVRLVKLPFLDVDPDETIAEITGRVCSN